MYRRFLRWLTGRPLKRGSVRFFWVSRLYVEGISPSLYSVQELYSIVSPVSTVSRWVRRRIPRRVLAAAEFLIFPANLERSWMFSA